MIWILATRGASTKKRVSPFTETLIEGVHSVVYRPGIKPIPQSGGDESTEPLGTFGRGEHRIQGSVLSYDGSAAETLLGITDAIDLIVYYRTGSQKRKRTITDILFIGDATVIVPALNLGAPELISVPFRAQIPLGETLADHVVDQMEV